MGPTALLPFWRNACWGFFRPALIPRTLVLKANTLPLDHRSRSDNALLWLMLVAYLLNGKGIILIYLMYFMVWNIVCVLWKVDLKAFCEWRFVLYLYMYISLVLGTASIFTDQEGVSVWYTNLSNLLTHRKWPHVLQIPEDGAACS
jgi:hypothetical protein